MDKSDAFKIRPCLRTSKHIGKTTHRASPQPQKYDNLVILDWDDTLMPTSFMVHYVKIELDANTQSVSRCLLDPSLLDPSLSALLSHFITELEAVGSAALKLLQTTLSQFGGSAVKIVTNCRAGWVAHSLALASSLCAGSGVFSIIEALLAAHQTEIIYARNDRVKQSSWKTNVFNDLILCRLQAYTAMSLQVCLNVITVGDQWTDHASVRHTMAWRMFEARLSHHQVKLFDEPDCRYLAMELHFVAEQMAQKHLRAWSRKGIVLEFEGYN